MWFYNYTDLVSCQISKYQLVSYVWGIPKELTDSRLPFDSLNNLYVFEED